MTRLYYGQYGHTPSGKQYVYYGGDNYRTGDSVVAPVTNHKSGKTYNTMFTIQRTTKVDSPMAESEIGRLESRGINIKSIGGRNVMDLPGATDWISARQWKQWADLVYEEEVTNRLMAYNTQADTTEARNRLLGV